MIVTRLQGGLGNRLFQIAASVGIGDFFGNDWRVQSDMLHKEYFSIPQIKFIDGYVLPRYTEPRFDYWLDEQAFSQPDLELFGYFQSARYFNHVQNQIRTLFAAPHKIEEKIKWKYRDVLKENTCAVHVRREDYLKLKDYHYNLEVEYYLKAMQSLPGFHFVCFSDDINWCKENIPAHTFIKDETPVEFHLMSYCKNFIIANSTFSWWASWLSNNESKIIIAPEKSKWFGKLNAAKNVNDLYCNNWVTQ